jgi:hypothetical protein
MRESCSTLFVVVDGSCIRARDSDIAVDETADMLGEATITTPEASLGTPDASDAEPDADTDDEFADTED